MAPHFMVIAPTVLRARHWANSNGYIIPGVPAAEYCISVRQVTRLQGRRGCALHLVDLAQWPEDASRIMEAIQTGIATDSWTGVHFHEERVLPVFISTKAPKHPYPGQYYFDPTLNKLRIYDGFKWVDKR